MQVAGNLDFLLSSKYPVKPFASAHGIDQTRDVAIEKPEVISPVFNLHKLQTKRHTDTGFYPGAPHPHPHTLIIISTKKNWSVEDTCAQGEKCLKYCTDIVYFFCIAFQSEHDK